MSLDVTQIELVRSQTIAQMLNLLATEGPAVTVGSEVIPWAPLLDSLQRTLNWCDRKLAEHQPYEVRSRGTT